MWIMAQIESESKLIPQILGKKIKRQLIYWLWCTSFQFLDLLLLTWNLNQEVSRGRKKKFKFGVLPDIRNPTSFYWHLY